MNVFLAVVSQVDEVFGFIPDSNDIGGEGPSAFAVSTPYYLPYSMFQYIKHVARVQYISVLTDCYTGVTWNLFSFIAMDVMYETVEVR